MLDTGLIATCMEMHVHLLLRGAIGVAGWRPPATFSNSKAFAGSSATCQAEKEAVPGRFRAKGLLGALGALGALDALDAAARWDVDTAAEARSTFETKLPFQVLPYHVLVCF